MLQTVVSLALLLAPVSAFAAADLSVHSQPQRIALGSTLEIPFEVRNLGPDVAPARVRFTLPSGLFFSASDWTCSESGAVVTCDHTAIPVFEHAEGRLILRQANASAGRFLIEAIVESPGDPQPDNNRLFLELVVFQRFAIGNDADSGPGSLREAIAEANASCLGDFDCEISVVVDAELAIELRSPLPPITACNLGFTAALTLDGSALAEGNGLEVRSRCPAHANGIMIRGLTIENFPGNGVLLASNDAVPTESCHLLLENTIRDNGLRGVEVASNGTCAYVQSNEISGNGRSGITLWAARSASIIGNRIHDNANSGVFTMSPAVNIAGNTITGNGQFGVGLPRDLGHISLMQNSIHANGELPIDWGLDRRTPNDADERDGIPNMPALTSAQIVIDAAGKTRTVIAGTVHSRKRPDRFEIRDIFQVSLFANSGGRAEAEEWLGDFPVAVRQAEGVFDATFEVTIERDLRGKTITARLLVFDGLGWSTSEISEGITPAASRATPFR